jgi:lipopolysaccharide transport system permease protein
VIAHPQAEPSVQVIEPPLGWIGFDLRELWRYRELLFFLTWRTILVRYKQTYLGLGWAVLQPFFLMVVFSIFFGRVAKISSNGLPYPIFAYAALLPWTFFANSLAQSSNSLVGNANLISKVYFPRLAIPMAAVFAALVDLVLAAVVLLGMMLYYGIHPRPIAVVAVPALVLLAIAAALGVGLWLSALNVLYRDIQYIVPFLIQIWLFVTPVIYSTTSFHEPWRTIVGLNPMAGVVEGFRWALLGTGPAIGPMAAVSTGASLLLLASGAAFFRHMERSFADIV